MDQQDLEACSDELRASAKALIRGSVALRAYSVALRRRHPRLGECARTGDAAVPRQAAELDGNGPGATELHAADARGRTGREPEAAVGRGPYRP